MNALETFLGIKATKLSLKDLWLQTLPPEAKGKPLLEFLITTVNNINCYDCFHEYDRYREDHAQKFGYPPYISPFMKKKWDLGERIPSSSKEQAVKEMKIFNSWFREHVLQEDKNTGSTAILVLPCALTKPWYRDVPGDAPDITESFTSLYLATITSMAQFVLPVGQTAYLSKVTERTEYLPFTASIAGAPGSDLMLLKLANGTLEKAGWPTKVLAGSRAFPVGDNNRKVGVEAKHDVSKDHELVDNGWEMVESVPELAI